MTTTLHEHESSNTYEPEDLIGAPYAVVESDPFVFTSMMQRLGVTGVQAEEIISLDLIESITWPYGFILCFKWESDSYAPEDYLNEESDTEIPWFAHQLSNDSCATLSILNVLMNCTDIDLGRTLTAFKAFTSNMDPTMRGLSIVNSRELRDVHNSFARPADLRASLSRITNETIEAGKSSKKSSKKAQRGKSKKSKDEALDSYHFLSYVPYQDRVWEMDGLKRAPLECSEIEDGQSWVEAVLPALRSRIEAFSRNGSISFTLLAVNASSYHQKLEDFELAKREIIFLERRLNDEFGEDWKKTVPNELWSSRDSSFSQSWPTHLRPGFGSRSNDTSMRVLHLSIDKLRGEWEGCVNRLVAKQLAVEDELRKDALSHVQNINRTHDYEPFIREYITRLYHNGFLRDILEVDAQGRFLRQSKGKRK
ncbi:hypothetical protein FRC18_009620 [Serendipita sp. 400]|nr:hypothetical protein FRC18_009620 [Serendipita sp. 400]